MAVDVASPLPDCDEEAAREDVELETDWLDPDCVDLATSVEEAELIAVDVPV